MDLTKLSNFELTRRLEKFVRTERKITHLILLYIIEIETRKIHLELGFDGMYSYLTKKMGYSESSAYSRLQAARLLKQTPEVIEKLNSGALNLSQLTQVQKCIREKQNEGATVSHAQTVAALACIENKNIFETKKALAKEFDLPIKAQENIRPQKDDSLRFEITLTKEQFEDLKRAKDLLSHICHEGTWSEVIGTLAKKFNQTKIGKGITAVEDSSEKISPKTIVGAETQPPPGDKARIEPALSTTSALLRPKQKSTQRFAATEKSRPYISVKTKRQLLQKSQFSCEYCDPHSGKICGSKFQLQIDHRHPVALGGGHEAENLRILCRSHNIHEARRLNLFQPTEEMKT